jgi:peptidoglycan/LPS O-acetylase OafA/YrhL
VSVPRPSTREAATGQTAGGNAPDRPSALRVDWLDPLKGFAILAVLLNHFVESVGPGPWFTNPSNDWPSLATRLHTFFPHDRSLLVAAVRTLGWLGDSGPGVFIFASGVGLTLAALSRPDGESTATGFNRRRLARLFPLYIAMHFIVLGGDLAVPGSLLTFGSPLTLFSLAGFRGTASLFYYIAPAWWYIWLILQLYLVYPFLLRWLQRTGPAWFFAGTLAITIASRGAGIRYSPHLYMWMTGMFAGTRLAEFTAGMVAAWWLAGAPAKGGKQPAAGQVTAWAAVIYVAGLACSVTLTGSLISNLLVTLGLSGLFYGMWRLLRARVPAVATGITVLGASSYAVYLLHQPLLELTRLALAGHRGPYLAAALIVLAASVPAGQAIERGTDLLVERAPTWLRAHATPVSCLTGIAIFVTLLGIEPLTASSSFQHRAVCFAVAAGTGAALWLEWLARPPGALAGTAPAAFPEPAWAAVARRTGLVAGLAGLFLMAPGYGYLAAPAGLIVALIATAADGSGARTRPPYWAWGAGIAGVLVLSGAGELVLRRVAPREVGGWGERPALMVHPTRAFGLIPNRVTHLRYNDYDYVVRTNALGLASPDIPVARPTPNTLRVLTTGDAFTMPEGLNYEQSFPALLDSALAQCLAPRPVQVINAGVTGYGPREEEPQFDELGATFRPDIVVHEFFVNDWSDIMIGAEERRQGIGLTKGRLTRGALLDRSDLVANARLLYERVVSAVSGRISDTQRYKLLLDYYRTGPNPLYDTLNVDRMTRFIAHFRDAARADGGTLVIFFTPGGVTVLPHDQIAYLPRSGIPLTDSVHYDLRRPFSTLERITDSLGVPLVDLTGPLRAYRPQPVYFPNQWHWTAAGHRAAAQAIMGTLSHQGLIAPACTG